ncbi:MAG: sugar phosphate isomerase/epimerase [Methanomicrobiales archaeon]|jgi:sugar phosphate isomerase/epimerase|nr:sugar phosphate isomerase/epimerase [Methanomicrobiales archaeon]
MKCAPYFSSSARVFDDISWISGIKDAGFSGWEIVADGNYRLDEKGVLPRIEEAVASTGLRVTVHAPYADLNTATLNYPIWCETVRQICVCIEKAATLTDCVTLHPGYLSPVGKLLPDKVWALQKEALLEIGRCAQDCGVTACVENMVGVKEFLCQVPSELFGMTDGIEGIGVTIDFGHAHTKGIVAAFAREVARATHVHIHDNHGSSDEHLSLESGTVPWKIVRDALGRDYHGIVVIEGRSLEEARDSISVYRRWFT